MKKLDRNSKGFTLVELLVTIVILGIITAMSLPLIRNIQESNQKKKFTTYSDSLESSAKLYVDSYSEDLFGHKDGGCAYITWQQLYEKDLAKDIQVADISCNSKNSFVKVVKYKDHYNYYPSLGCGNKKNGEASKVTVTLPDENRAQEIEEESCGGPNGSSMNISASPSGYSKTDRKKIGIDVKITSPTGINNQKSISYAWSRTNTYSDSLDWKKLDIDIPSADSQEERIISGNSIEVESYQISTPTNQTGEYYLVIKVDALSDLFGTPWNEGEADKKNYVIFGKYVIDNTKPVIHFLNATSSESSFNSVTPKVSLSVTDVLAQTSELKMCYSYDADNCGKSKSAFASSKYTKYTASKVLSKIKNNVDGTSHRIYITVVDPAGNYTTKNVGYTISLKYNVSYNFNGGKKGASAPTVAYADRETTISNPSKTITASFNSNGKGAAISSTSSITKNYTFSGWKGDNLASTALTGTYSANASWNGLPTTNTKFKALANKYNATVKMTANWRSPSITLPTISKTGYTCIWNEAAACNGSLSWNGGAAYTPTSATQRTFYTCCTPNTYTLTYNSNGGSVCGSKTGKYDSKWGTLCTPTRTGYTFKGWYSGATKVTSDTIVRGNLTVTANWQANTYTLTINNGGGSGCGNQSKTYGSKWDACTPSRSGYIFTGWSYNFGGQIVTGNQSATANWIKSTYTLTINNNGGSGCGNQVKNYNAKWDACTPSRPGYTFTGWSYNFAGQTVNANRSATASWKITPYTITFNGNGSSIGATSASCTPGTANGSCKVTTPSISRSGYTILGWGTSAGKHSASYGVGQAITVNSNATLYAITSQKLSAKFSYKISDSQNISNKNSCDSGHTYKTVSCTRYNTSTTCDITAPGISFGKTIHGQQVGAMFTSRWVYSGTKITAGSNITLDGARTYTLSVEPKSAFKSGKLQIDSDTANIWIRKSAAKTSALENSQLIGYGFEGRYYVWDQGGSDDWSMNHHTDCVWIKGHVNKPDGKLCTANKTSSGCTGNRDKRVPKTGSGWSAATLLKWS